jgi:hypothetical protein
MKETEELFAVITGIILSTKRRSLKGIRIKAEAEFTF